VSEDQNNITLTQLKCIFNPAPGCYCASICVSICVFRSWSQTQLKKKPPPSLSSVSQQPTHVLWSNLVALHQEVVCGDQGFEDHHPAGVAGPLYQCVSHLGNVHVGFLGGLDQVWEAQRRGGTGGEWWTLAGGDTQHRYRLCWKLSFQVMTMRSAAREMAEDRWVRNNKQHCARMNVITPYADFAAVLAHSYVLTFTMRTALTKLLKGFYYSRIS